MTARKPVPWKWQGIITFVIGVGLTYWVTSDFGFAIVIGILAGIFVGAIARSSTRYGHF